MAGTELVPAVAAHGLASSAHALPDEPLDDDAWGRLLGGVRGQRLTGLLAAAITDEAMPVTGAQRQEAADAHEQAMAHTLVMERLLLEVDAAFAGAGVGYRVLKGLALAHLDYPPERRSTGDLDVLVAPDDLAEAVRRLEALGLERRTPELRRGFERRFAKCVELALPGGHEVDLHRSLVLEPFGATIALGDLLARPDHFTVAGRPVPALPRDLRFLNACYHAALGNSPPRLVAVRDVAQLLPDDAAVADKVIDTARRWRGEAVLVRALRVAAGSLRIPLPSRWQALVDAHAPSRWEERALAAYLAPGRRHRDKALVTLSVLPGWRARGAYLRAMLLPDRVFVDARGRGYRAWWRRALPAPTGRRR